MLSYCKNLLLAKVCISSFEANPLYYFQTKHGNLLFVFLLLLSVVTNSSHTEMNWTTNSNFCCWITLQVNDIKPNLHWWMTVGGKLLPALLVAWVKGQSILVHRASYLQFGWMYIHLSPNLQYGNVLEEIWLYETRHEKTCLCHMRTTKGQISLHIRAVWSGPLLFAA